MHFLLLFNFKVRYFSLLFLICIFHSSFYKAQADSLQSTQICKQLAIQSAQLADKSHFFSEKSYFETRPVIIKNYTDSALSYIKESIFFLDSALVLASDSAILGIKYANIARNFAIDCYHALIHSKNSRNYNQIKELLKNATYYSANNTVDAYSASFYLSDREKIKKKVELPKIDVGEKQITKLDIDQTLFTLLKQNINEKSETNKQEITKLSDELSNTKDTVKTSRLKSQLQSLELQEKDFDKKNKDVEVKLSTINTLIENRDKYGVNNELQKDTVFSKTVTKKNDEWNDSDKFETNIPDSLVYQIQLGIFKNTVKIEEFKGFTPIYSTITESGVCYSTGLFYKLEDAKEAKNTIKSMGLKDAFIIAYYNKKKITLNEAVKLEKK